MSRSTGNQYKPDYVAPPGEILVEALEERQMSQAGLAERMGRIDQPIEILQQRMPDLAAEAGVAIVFVDTITGAPIIGATRWLSPKKAQIQLSYSFQTYDQLWFTFFHEAGHILLHGKRETFIDDDSIENVKESEADQFASSILVPREQLEEFVTAQDFSLRAIDNFAAHIGVTPDIVVGQYTIRRSYPLRGLPT